MDNLSVSIIIPTKLPNENLRKCIDHCLALDYPDYEILVLPDRPSSISEVKVISTGEVGPSEKRGMAISQAKGELFGGRKRGQATF